MNDAEIFERLVRVSLAAGIEHICLCDFRAYYGVLLGRNIALGMRLSLGYMNYTLAHELAHVFLHYDKGDTMKSDLHDDYEEQADRAARLLLCAVSGMSREEVDHYVREKKGFLPTAG